MMPFLGSARVHTSGGTGKSARFLQNYLERGENGRDRAIAHDFANLTSKDERRNWSGAMDFTRELFGNDTGWRGKEGILFRHFVISPDPKDGVDLETLRALTMQWVNEWFGGIPNKDGKLGCYEVAVVYHDDNTNHVPHAHVVVNNTDLATTKRMNVTSKKREEMFDRLQEIAREYGLSYLERGTEGGNVAIGARLTREERKLVKQGKYSWKQDLRERIDVARRTTSDEESFVRELGTLGVEARDRDGEYIYSLNCNPERYRAMGYRLGKDYMRPTVLDGMERRRNGPSPETRERVRRNVNRAIVAELLAASTAAAVVGPDVTLSEAAETLRLNDRENIRCMSDYAVAMQRALARYKSLASVDAERAEAQAQLYRDLSAARKVAERGSFFKGVGDLAPLPSAAEAAASVRGRARAENDGAVDGGARSRQVDSPSRSRSR